MLDLERSSLGDLQDVLRYHMLGGEVVNLSRSHETPQPWDDSSQHMKYQSFDYYYCLLQHINNKR